MNKIVTLIVLLFISFESYGQTNEILTLRNKELNADEKGVIKFIAHSIRNINHKDSRIILLNGDTLTRYISQKFTIIKSDTSLSNIISVITGINKNNIPVLIIDKNFNNIFSDDSVYVFKSSTNEESEKTFYNDLPEIILNSPALGKTAKDHKSYTKLKLAPYIDGTPLFNDAAIIENAKQLGLSFYATNYLSTFFTINQQIFEIAIIPHPLALSVLRTKDVSQGFNKWMFNIYQINSNSEDKLIYGTFFQKIVDHEKDIFSAIKILDKYIMITDFSLDSNKISIQVMDSSAYAIASHISQKKIETFPLISSFNLNEKKDEPFNFANHRLTLVEFSGSWCIPCIDALPDLKKIYIKYSDKIQFLSVMEEYGKNEAFEYFKKYKLPWKIFYENINCNSCLKTEMNVKVFPSFFLVNDKSQIVYKANTSDGLIEIENEIKKYLSTF